MASEPTSSTEQPTSSTEHLSSSTAQLSVAERAARGKAARSELPRSSHAAFEPGAPRADPIALLESQDATRVPELVPIRYGRMLASPFAFYRGAAKIMASDLATTPRTGLTVQCCGDAHVANFGVFASPERRLVFDVNDFDETLPGPWEWDVKRLVTSMVIAARENGFAPRYQNQIASGTVAEYRTTMTHFAGMKNLDVWYAHLDVSSALGELGPQLNTRLVEQTEKSLSKARTDGNKASAGRLTHEVDGEPRIVAEPPLIVPISDLAKGSERDDMFEGLHEHLRSYRASLEWDRRVLLKEFRAVDFARKVVGVGSVGTRAWIALLVGLDGTDPLFLQLKEADASVLEEFVGRSEFHNHAERVVTGQRLVQAVSDIFLGWLHLESGLDGQPIDFYVRQLRDWKGAGNIAKMTPKAMAQYGRFCAWALARGHARSGDRIAIASYLGQGSSFDHAIVEFSHAYAEQNERDYQALEAAVKAGRITAQTGV
jgi:uncharacterized protein (DUF2252 family)